MYELQVLQNTTRRSGRRTPETVSNKKVILCKKFPIFAKKKSYKEPKFSDGVFRFVREWLKYETTENCSKNKDTIDVLRKLPFFNANHLLQIKIFVKITISQFFLFKKMFTFAEKSTNSRKEMKSKWRKKRKRRQRR